MFLDVLALLDELVLGGAGETALSRGAQLRSEARSSASGGTRGKHVGGSSVADARLRDCEVNQLIPDGPPPESIVGALIVRHCRGRITRDLAGPSANATGGLSQRAA